MSSRGPTLRIVRRAAATSKIRRMKISLPWRALSRVAALALLAHATGGNARADSVIVLNSAGNTVSLIDPRTYKETARLPIGKQPHHMMATPDDDALLVGSTSSNELYFVDRKTGAITTKMPMQDPYQLGFSPDRKWFVTTALRMNYVDIYAGDEIIGKKLTARPIKRVRTGSMPSHLAFSGDSKLIYVTEQGADTVSVIDLATQRVLQTIQVGDEPAGVWVYSAATQPTLANNDKLEAFPWNSIRSAS